MTGEWKAHNIKCPKLAGPQAALAFPKTEQTLNTMLGTGLKCLEPLWAKMGRRMIAGSPHGLRKLVSTCRDSTNPFSQASKSQVASSKSQVNSEVRAPG